MNPWDFLATRVIRIAGEITSQTGDEVIAQLLTLQSTAPTVSIRIEIDSPGGRLLPCLAIRDTIDELSAPVRTHAAGLVGGSAVIVLAHGARGHRTATPFARVAMTPFVGVRKGLVEELLAADTGQLVAQLERDLSASRRFNAEKACAYGLIDTIEAARD